jgi:hypothetical protein
MDDCPTGCGRTHRDGHLMCGPCWSLVPKHLQRDVLRTWQKWRRDFGDTDAFTEYLAARDAAITFLTGQEA